MREDKYAFHSLMVAILLHNLLIFNAATDATEGYIKIIEPIK